MRISFYLIIFSFLCLMSLGISDGYAQDVLTDDNAETSSKFSDWVNKQKNNFQETTEQISQSQFATTIGDGVKAAKQGVKFVKDKIGDVKQFIKDVKESDEYKIAMLAKQIAEKTKELADLEKQREETISSLKSEAELKRTTLQEKIAQAQENIKTMAEVSENTENNENVDSDTPSVTRASSEEFIDITDSDITTMIAELEALDSNLEADIKSTSIEYAELIYAKGEEIAELTQDMDELMSKRDRETDKASSNPDTVIADAQDSFSFKAGDIITLDDRKNKERKRKSKLISSMTASQNASTENITSSQDTKEQLEQVASADSTQQGSSEVLQTAIDSTTNQLDSIYNYLLIELKFLEARSAYLLSQEKDYEVDKTSSVLDICNYSGDKKESAFGSITDAYNKVKEKTQDVGSVVSKVQDIKNKAEEISSGIQEAKSVANDIKSVAGSSAITGMSGMN